MFPEPASYENYVPKRLSGTYEDFTEFIPTSEKYWIDKFNNNLLYYNLSRKIEMIV